MNYYLLSIIVIVIAIIGKFLLKNVDLETFVPYKKPYNEWSTGSTPQLLYITNL